MGLKVVPAGESSVDLFYQVLFVVAHALKSVPGLIKFLAKMILVVSLAESMKRGQ